MPDEPVESVVKVWVCAPAVDVVPVEEDVAGTVPPPDTVPF